MWGDSPSSSRWWLGYQVGFGLGGGAIWVVGQVAGSDFVGGAGLGLVAAALLLRFGRRAVEASPDQ